MLHFRDPEGIQRGDNRSMMSRRGTSPATNAALKRATNKPRTARQTKQPQHTIHIPAPELPSQFLAQSAAQSIAPPQPVAPPFFDDNYLVGRIPGENAAHTMRRALLRYAQAQERGDYQALLREAQETLRLATQLLQQTNLFVRGQLIREANSPTGPKGPSDRSRAK